MLHNLMLFQIRTKLGQFAYLSACLSVCLSERRMIQHFRQPPFSNSGHNMRAFGSFCNFRTTHYAHYAYSIRLVASNCNKNNKNAGTRFPSPRCRRMPATPIEMQKSPACSYSPEKGVSCHWKSFKLCTSREQLLLLHSQLINR